jgi:hypothetical protein
MITKGMKIKRSSVIWFGAVQNWFFTRVPWSGGMSLGERQSPPARPLPQLVA